MQLIRMPRMTIATIISSIAVLALIVIGVLFVVFFGFFTSSDRTILTQKLLPFTHNNTKRYYRLHESKNQPERIVVGLHGFNDTTRKFSYYTGLHNAVDDSTIVIYPEATQSKRPGIMRGWNAGFCCGSGYLDEIDDAGFIMALIESIREEYSLPNIPLYITGFSNGGFMTQRLATEYPEKITAVAVVSGAIGTDKKSLAPTAPMPILFFHGEKDLIVPFNGGVGSSDAAFSWKSFAETTSTWQAVNGEKAETKIVTFADKGHVWNGWRIFNLRNTSPSTSKEIFNFFLAHPTK